MISSLKSELDEKTQVISTQTQQLNTVSAELDKTRIEFEKSNYDNEKVRDFNSGVVIFWLILMFLEPKRVIGESFN